MTPTFVALVVSACLAGTGAHQGKRVCMHELPIWVPSHNTMDECRDGAVRAIDAWERSTRDSGIEWQDEHFRCARISQESEED